jgi:hypothetical protein
MREFGDVVFSGIARTAMIPGFQNSIAEKFGDR